MPATATRRPPAYRSQPSRSRPRTNVGDSERLLSVVGGGALGLLGLSRGSLAGLALAGVGGALLYRGLTGHCDVYQMLGVSTAEERGPATSIPAGHGVKLEEGITINRPVEEVFRFWRNLENLPRFMNNLDSVKNLGNKRSHWVARGPMGMTLEWDAEIITERPNELIGWRSVGDNEVETAGSVHFNSRPFGRGTEVHVTLKYDPPAGKAGAALAKVFGSSPQSEIREDLRRLKQLLECGEIATISGQPQGTCR